MTERLHFDTRAIHSFDPTSDPDGGVSPAIQLSTTFSRNPEGQPIGDFTYIREGNPNEAQLETLLASLDGGEAALAFGSGMAACAAFFQSLPPGTHVLLAEDCYYGVRALAAESFERSGLSYQLIDMLRVDLLATAARAGCVIWTETPSNPLLKLTDLEAVAAIARAHEATLVVDGTFATPALQRPIEYGADVVMHSTTKYMGGHSDVHGGALVFRHDGQMYERVRHLRHLTGGVGSPFAHWLVARGLRTLSARMRVHCDNARQVAQFLSEHAAVEALFFPGAPAHPGHEIARRQMSDFGAMLSFTLRAGPDAALRVVGRTRLFVRATSLGGVESLIEHRASSEGPGSTTPQNLLRCSVGLEYAADLIADLKQALEA